jgi:hypothetical protein
MKLYKTDLSKTLFFIIVLLIGTFGCDSEQEKIHKAQIKTCKEQIKAGQQPTEFCLNLLPEYRSVAQAPQQQPLQQYAPQQYAEPAPQQQYAPQTGQAPVIVQQPAQQSSGMQDMLLGGLIGHAIGSSGNNTGGGSPQYYAQPSRVIERNTTIVRQAPAPVTPKPVTAPAPKPNYMDTSKLSSYGARPSAPKSSAMNMGRLSSSGRR